MSEQSDHTPAKRHVRRPHSFVLEYEKQEISFMFAANRHAIPLTGGGGGVGVERRDFDAWGLEQDVTVAELNCVQDEIIKFLCEEVVCGSGKRSRTFLAGAVRSALFGQA